MVTETLYKVSLPHQEELERFNRSLAEKDSRLTTGVLDYILDLKAQKQGSWEEAMGFSPVELGVKRAGGLTTPAVLHRTLDKTVRLVIETRDEIVEAEGLIRAAWLLHGLGIISDDQKTTDLLKVLASESSAVQEYLTPDKLNEIKDSVLYLKL